MRSKRRDEMRSYGQAFPIAPPSTWDPKEAAAKETRAGWSKLEDTGLPLSAAAAAYLNRYHGTRLHPEVVRIEPVEVLMFDLGLALRALGHQFDGRPLGATLIAAADEALLIAAAEARSGTWLAEVARAAGADAK